MEVCVMCIQVFEKLNIVRLGKVGCGWVKILANKVVQHSSNSTAKGMMNASFEGELLNLSHQSTCRDSIYKIGKA